MTDLSRQGRAGEPVISVIVPTHDRRAFLQRKLAALEAEPLDFEVIVVADACSDDTEAFLEQYRPPYRLNWTTAPGRHAAYARNRGAELAAAELLLFSDDDVIARPGWLAANLALHEQPGRVGVTAQALPEGLEFGFPVARLQGWWNVSGNSTSLSKELFRRVGGYDESFDTYGGEDPDLAYRLKLAGAVFALVEGAVVEHWHDGFVANLEAKARSAGRAHVQVWRKHRSFEIALALGVHPLSLALKRLLLGPWARRLMGEHLYRWEVAYAQGAREAIRAAGSAHG